MTARRLARALILAAAPAAALLLAAVPARAEVGGGYDPDGGAPRTTTEVTVTSGPEGVTIHIESERVTPGTEGGSGGGSPDGGGSPPTCQASPVNVGHTGTGWVAEGLAENPGTFPWGVSCDDGTFGIAWVPTGGPGTPSVVVGEAPPPPIDPRVVRDALFRIVPVPPISVGVNPAPGLVAVESWFWVDGHAGGTVRGSAALEGSHVEVEMTPVRYRWSWGDGGSLTTRSPGLAFPSRSTIRHTYERSSLRAGDSYRVLLEITWEARYSENGGAWLPLDPITRGYARSYPVRQLQSVLTASR